MCAMCWSVYRSMLRLSALVIPRDMYRVLYTAIECILHIPDIKKV